MDPAPDPHTELTRELLRGARAGHRPDLEGLCQRIAPAVYTWARMRMRHTMRTRIDPDDVVQEVWVRVLRKLPELEPESVSFRAWVIGVARNVLFELSRRTFAKDRARQPAPVDSKERWDSFFEQQADPVTGVSVRVARREVLDAFLARVERIGELERRLVLLRGIEQRSFEEIAAETGLSLENASKRWQRLRARLIEEGLPQYLFD